MWLLEYKFVSISSLLQNPANGNIPDRLNAPIKKAKNVRGIYFLNPPKNLMSKVPPAA